MNILSKVHPRKNIILAGRENDIQLLDTNRINIEILQESIRDRIPISRDKFTMRIGLITQKLIESKSNGETRNLSQLMTKEPKILSSWNTSGNKRPNS